MKTTGTIIRAIITEKSSNRQAEGKYTFEVGAVATKIDIRKEMKELYGVDVESVKVMRGSKKQRLVGKGRIWTKRPIIKKAIVTIKGKKTIDINKFKEPKK